MAARLEGIIVLSADGRPIVHSHFANHIPAYPHLHADYFGTLLAAINSANAHIASLSSPAAGSSTDKIYFSKDIKPVLWVSGIPDVNPNDLNNESSDEEEENLEDEVGELSMASQLSARISQSSRQRSSNPEQSNVWEDSKRNTDVASDSIPLAPSASTKAEKVVNSGSQALAEQGASLIHIQSGSLRFLCPVSREVDPLVPMTFLRSFIAILQEYLVQSTDPALLTEDVLRDHFDIVYQLFEEILDTDGNILTTEVNMLKSLVLPPNWVGKLVKAVGVSGLASAAPPALISPIPWRRPNSKYTNNELYVDLVETLEGIVSRNGKPLSLEVWGAIECNARLSGVPDLSLSLNMPNLVQDESFHPCVRSRVWRKDRKLSFVPPDGAFELLGFRVGDPSASSAQGSNPLNGWGKSVPLTLTHAFELSKGTGEGCIQVAASTASASAVSSSNSIMGGGVVLEDVIITFGLSPGVVSMEASVGGGITSQPLTCSITPSAATTPDSYGSYIYDPNNKTIKWTIPRLSPGDRPALLKLQWSISDQSSRPTTSSAITTQWSNPAAAISGLKVTSVDLTNQATHPYRPFKGVRSISRGKLVWRI